MDYSGRSNECRVKYGQYDKTEEADDSKEIRMSKCTNKTNSIQPKKKSPSVEGVE